MFVKNAWYVAATPNEIDDKPLGRRVCGERIVFYRAEGGRAAALEDWCPHRGAPLSLGRVVEGKLVCGYHGLEMGCDGKTIAMPGQRVLTGTLATMVDIVQREQPRAPTLIIVGNVVRLHASLAWFGGES